MKKKSRIGHYIIILLASLALMGSAMTLKAEDLIVSFWSNKAYLWHFDGSRWSKEVKDVPNSVNGIPLWGGSSYIRLGDFDGDGKLDIGSPRGGYILVKDSKLSPPTLNWSAPSSVTSLWGGASYLRVGDFNGDGRDDFASPYGGSVYMKLGQPYANYSHHFDSQTWSVTSKWGSGEYTWVGDFNGDGRDDLASASGKYVYMKLSTGTAFISQTWNVDNYWGGSGYTWVGDFNGDGLDDIASAYGDRVYMKISTGIGFSSQTWSVSNHWGGSSGYNWVEDFNGDGRADIASAYGDKVYLKLSQGNSFISTFWSVTNQWGSASYTWVMDFNNDGRKDIVSANGSKIYTKRNNAGVGFISETWSLSYPRWGSSAYTWASDGF